MMNSGLRTLVYAGDSRRGAAIRAGLEPMGWTVLVTKELLETLATHIFYQPNLYILEDAPLSTLAEEAFFHLLTVDAAPILVLTSAERVEDWKMPPSRGRVVPRPERLEQLNEWGRAMLRERAETSRIERGAIRCRPG